MTKTTPPTVKGRGRICVAALVAGALTLPAVTLIGLTPAHAVDGAALPPDGPGFETPAEDRAPVFGDSTQQIAVGGVPSRLEATDPDGTEVTFAVVATPGNALPAGLTLHEHGFFMGSVDAYGTTTTTIAATSGGKTTTAQLTVTAKDRRWTDFNGRGLFLLQGVTSADQVSVTVPPSHGTVGVQEADHEAEDWFYDGFFLVYNPTTGFVGNDTVEYTVPDSAGAGTVTKEVTFEVAAVKHDDAQTTIGTSVLVDVLANDHPVLLTGALRVEHYYDEAGVDLLVTGGTAAVEGTQVRFTPKPGYSGQGTFYYTVVDAFARLHQGFASVYVDAAVEDDEVTVASGSQTVVAVLANDTGSFQQLVQVTQPTHGTATINEDRTITYVPTAGYSGPDTFHYTVADGSGWKQYTAAITVTVTPPAVSIPPETPPQGTIPPETAPPVVTPPVTTPPVTTPPVTTPPVTTPPVTTPPVTVPPVKVPPVTATLPVKAPPAVTPPAKPAAGPAGTVTLGSKPAITTAPRSSFPVSGTVSQAKAGIKVTVQARRSGGRWTTVAAARTNDKGQFTTGLKAPTRKGVYTYRVVGAKAGTPQVFTVTVR